MDERKIEIDDYNENRLRCYKLPIIKNKNQLFEVLEITKKLEIKFFYTEARKSLYKEVSISKKDGKERKLKIPIDELKTIQRAINKVILNRFNMSNEANAYIKGKSIVTNALPHIKAKTLIKMDITNFFPSITFFHVYYQFRFFGYGKSVSKYLTLLCVDEKMQLPQGAPTSPSLSNLISIIMDKRISSYCRKHNLAYTRYADDITISATNKLTKFEIYKIKKMVFTIIECYGFKPNLDKCKEFYNGQKLLVTGVIVNDKLSIPKEMKREIENAIRYIGKYDLDDHLKHIKCDKRNYVGHLYGLANFIKMIDKEKGNAYLKQLDELNL